MQSSGSRDTGVLVRSYSLLSGFVVSESLDVRSHDASKFSHGFPVLQLIRESLMVDS